ncbi:thioesterase II family protein [Streptomyces sp. NPDC087532]
MPTNLASRLDIDQEARTDQPTDPGPHAPSKIANLRRRCRLARRMQAAGNGPAELFISGRRAPSLDRGDEWQPSADEEVVAEVRKLNGTGGALLGEEETLRMILPALRADYGAVRDYRHRPGPALDCPVTAFTGDQDPKARLEDVQAWVNRTRSGFGPRVLPGGSSSSSRNRTRTVQERLARTPVAVPA